MLGAIITLPLRLSVGAAGLVLRGVEQAGSRALAMVQCTLGQRVSRTDTHGAEIYSGQAAVSDERSFPPAQGEPARGRDSGNGVAPVAARTDERTAASEPVHVSEDPELVEELAEPGAEEGAGAQVTVLEPWNGYQRMNARDVIARLAAADRAELAAVELYERQHRNRRTVLAVAERRLAR